MDGHFRDKGTEMGRAVRVQSLHPLHTVQLLNGSDSHATENPVSQCATEREIIVVRQKETQMEKGSSDGIIGELIEVRLGKDEHLRFCAQ